MFNAFRKLLRLERPPELPNADILDFPRPSLQPVPDPEPEETENSFTSILTATLDEIAQEELEPDESESEDDPHEGESNTQQWSNEMSQHHNDCHDHHKRKYVCFNPPAKTQVGTYYEFTSLCCDDDIQQAAQDFYDFAIMKKGGNAAIEKVELVISPNGSSRFVVIHWDFKILVALILADAEELWEKYLDLLGF